MPAVFINYRTVDEIVTAILLDRELSRRFGSDQIFLSGKSIRPGTRWESALQEAVRCSGALVAVIGQRWLAAPDRHGGRALDNPNDWTRREIVEALAGDVRVIPVLVGATPRLDESDLPEALAPLAATQYLRLDLHDVDGCLARLTAAVVEAVPELGNLAP